MEKELFWFCVCVKWNILIVCDNDFPFLPVTRHEKYRRIDVSHWICSGVVQLAPFL